VLPFGIRSDTGSHTSARRRAPVGPLVCVAAAGRLADAGPEGDETPRAKRFGESVGVSGRATFGRDDAVRVRSWMKSFAAFSISSAEPSSTRWTGASGAITHAA